MLACPERGDGQLRMCVGGRADVHKLNCRVGEQLGEVVIGFDSRHVELGRFGGTGVAADLREIAVEVASTRIADGDNAIAINLAIRLEVRGGHETEADEADADRTVHGGWLRVDGHY